MLAYLTLAEACHWKCHAYLVVAKSSWLIVKKANIRQAEFINAYIECS